MDIISCHVDKKHLHNTVTKQGQLPSSSSESTLNGGGGGGNGSSLSGSHK